MRTLQNPSRTSLVSAAIVLFVALTGCQPEGLVFDPQSGQWVSPLPTQPGSPVQMPTAVRLGATASSPLPTVTPLPTLPPEPTRSGTRIPKHGPTLTPSPTRPPVLLTPTPVGSPPADLQALYYVANNNGAPELRVIGIDDQGRKWLETNVPNLPPSHGYALHASPDGKYLAIDIAYGGLYVLERSSGRIWCPFSNERGECDGYFGDWMLDDRLLLRPGGGAPPEITPGGVLVININTSQYEQLDLPVQPQWGYSLVQHVSLSPDRTKLAYSIIYHEDQKEISEIWIMRLDSKDKQLVRKIEAAINALAWSPTGEQLLCLCQPGTRPAQTDPTELWLLSSDGTDAKLLVGNLRNADNRNFEPAWSPDGRHVAFVKVDNTALFLSDPRGPGTNMYVLNTVTGQLARLSAFEGRSNHSPTWSPNGEFVAFVSSIFSIDRYGETPQHMEVWIASADGRQLHALSGTVWPGTLAWLPSMPSAQEK